MNTNEYSVTQLVRTPVFRYLLIIVGNHFFTPTKVPRLSEMKNYCYDGRQNVNRLRTYGRVKTKIIERNCGRSTEQNISFRTQFRGY